MLRRRPRLQLLLFALLALATLVRPLLIAACDIHAVAHAHAAQPHEHAGEGDTGDDDAHGVHETLQQGSLAAATDTVIPFELPVLAFGAVVLPEAPPTPLAAHYRGAPFRPPIA